MRNYVISLCFLWLFSAAWAADEAVKKFQEENPLRPYLARTLIVNEKDPHRIIAVKGDTLIFIRGNIIEVTVREMPNNSTESTDEDN